MLEEKVMVKKKSYYDNGKLNSIGKLQNDKRIGLWKFYYKSGELKNTVEYVDGKSFGEVKWYHENGVLHSFGRFEHGKQIGQWIYYDEKGNLIETKIY